MDKASFIEQQKSSEFSKIRTGAGKFIARLGIAGLCLIPTADLALSDGVSAKVFNTVENQVHLVDNKPANRIAQNSVVGATIAIESMAFGELISRNKKIRNSFDDLDEYVGERQSKMKPLRKAASKVFNTPFKAYEYVSKGFEKVGDKLNQRQSRAARSVGHLAIDTAHVNAMGTSNVIMQETMAGSPPSTARNARLAGIITASWLGSANAIQEIYRNVPYASDVLGPIGRTMQEFTSVQDPRGIALLGSIATGMAVTGYRIAKFHEQRQDLPIDQQISQLPVEDIHALNNRP